MKVANEKLTNAINMTIEKLEDKSGVSDGSHTFDELYYHRMYLFSIICSQNRDNAWKSKKHDDGTMFEDYFIVGISTDGGDFSYHYQMKYWNFFTDVTELEFAPLWDGHDSTDIIRLSCLLEEELGGNT